MKQEQERALPSKLLLQFFDSESSRYGEHSNVILQPRFNRSDKIGKAHVLGIAILVFGLLTQAEESGKHFCAVVILVDENIIASTAGRVQAHNASALQLLILQQILQESLSIGKQLLLFFSWLIHTNFLHGRDTHVIYLGLFANRLIVEDLWIVSIRILSTQVVHLEEGIPIVQGNGKQVITRYSVNHHNTNRRRAALLSVGSPTKCACRRMGVSCKAGTRPSRSI